LVLHLQALRGSAAPSFGMLLCIAAYSLTVSDNSYRLQICDRPVAVFVRSKALFSPFDVSACSAPLFIFLRNQELKELQQAPDERAIKKEA
jgi:hypothetical protein